MRRFGRWLSGALLALYPRWFRRHHGEELRRSVEESVESSSGWIGRAATTAWLVRDGITTAVRARVEGPPPQWDRTEEGMMSAMWNELRMAIRSLVRTPGFTAVATLTLALGIGMNASIFGIVYSVLLEPLPYEQPEQVVQLQNRYSPGGQGGWVSGAELAIFAEETVALQAMVPLTPVNSNLTGLPTPLRLEGLMVGAGYFELLGADMQLGRGFVDEESRPGGDPVVVLSDGLWRSAFGSDPGIIGRTIELDGVSRIVVGVVGPEYRTLSTYVFGGRGEAFFLPVMIDPSTFNETTVERHNLFVLGRLTEGWEAEGAETAMLDEVRRLVETYPGISNAESRDVAVVPLRRLATAAVDRPLGILTVAALLLLVVAAVNVANLMLVRRDTRLTEAAVRAAIGAGRGRLAAYGLAESLVLGLVGGALGLGLALFVRGALIGLVPEGAPMPPGSGFVLPVAGFSLAVALVAGLVTGLGPALGLARGDLFARIRSGATDGSGPGGRGWGRTVSVAAQIAGAVVLVSSAGLLLRSLAALGSVDPGFDYRDGGAISLVQVNATRANYPDAESVRELYRTLEDRVGRLPGVASVAASWQTPLQPQMSDYPVYPERDGESEWYSADPNLVTPGFFETYGIRVIEGRAFDASDTEAPLAPVIISRTAARRLWGEGPAVGRRVNLSFSEPEWREVVGVVEDLRGRSLAQEPRVQTYLPVGEGPFAGLSSLTLAVRGDLPAARLRDELRSILASIDPDIPVGEVRTLESQVADSLARERLLSTLLMVFAGVTLLLGSLGVYGMLAYTVARRTREMGLRIAVGADPRLVMRMVVAQGLRIGVVGVVLGVVASVGAGRLLESFLFGVGSADVPTLATVAVGVLVVAVLASVLPARRAASVDPAVALTNG